MAARERAGKYVKVVGREGWIAVKKIISKAAKDARVRKEYKARAHKAGLPQKYEMRWEEEDSLKELKNKMASELFGLVKMDDVYRAILRASRFVKTIADGTRYIFGIPCRVTMKFEEGHPYFEGEVTYDVGSYVVLVKPEYDEREEKTITHQKPIYECCRIYDWNEFVDALKKVGLYDTAMRAVNNLGMTLREFVEQGYHELVAQGSLPEIKVKVAAAAYA